MRKLGFRAKLHQPTTHPVRTAISVVSTACHEVGRIGSWSAIVLRPVSSEDAMTADWTRLPYDVLEKISTRIANEVRKVNRVVLDVTSKPPGPIEWE